ncbi:MAG: VTT domain-containing protein [Ruminococcus sp.]|nr:VTT domain-containing protein [Ruminococcus sp.]
MKKLFDILIKLSPFLMIAICIFFFWKNFRGVPLSELAGTIISYVPPEPLLAAVIIILMFLLKSLSVVFPMVALIVASGMMFPLPVALLINSIGILTMLTMPYIIGRFAEAELAEKLLQKYPKLQKIHEFQTQNEFFVSYFLRVLNLPADVVSMYLGAVKTKASRYYSGSFLGILPGLIFTTIAGAAVDDPLSPQFIGAIAIEIVFSVGSGVGYAIYKKKKA